MSGTTDLVLVRVRRSGAIIFDLDGTLVDSSEVVERQWSKWARHHSLDPAAVMAVVHGRPSLQTMRLFIPEITVEESQEFDRIEAADIVGLRPVLGAREATQAVIDAGIRWAIVTSGTFPMASTRLKVTGFSTPEVFVTVEQTRKGKPFPDPFLKAAEAMKVSAGCCTVFEDSPPGIESAKAAGMRVIALATTHQPARLSSADAILKDLTEAQIVVAEE